MLFDDDDQVDDGPVSDDGEESLERVFEKGSRAAADGDSGDEANCHEGDAWNAEGPRAEVLCVQGEGVVVWDVVLVNVRTGV